ncbi:S8 family serine peptidase [Nocardia donostiensis]|uniref:Serine protease n=1 Tax=Nocardia donostiensis TaxID=1538463 RepID=A0A1W0BMN1_9NOCA|nr:S8 family serine peptidase [Nocardia donostiensis]ONM50109.1 serine protease [Nocardia donostiensis]OQS15771.1 serine protease [Nocardia donostiensis]OQS23576.1 serine protease [Nocardia donostiensis]
MGSRDQHRNSIPHRQAGPTRSPAELIVLTHGAHTAIETATVRESVSAHTRLAALLPQGAQVSRVFGPANRVRNRLAGTAAEPSGGEFLNYFSIRGLDTGLTELADQLRVDDTVAAAYVKPPAEPPLAPSMTGAVADIAARALTEPPAVTPDFAVRQGYLAAAPDGVDAHWAWSRPGGRGAGVRVIDVEGAWQFSHEDLLDNQGGVIGGEPSPDLGWRNHGTAVAGQISADVNEFGVTGIAPEAGIRAVSIFGTGSAAAIRAAADALHSGDILLIELHRPGPRFDYSGRPDQRGYIAIEWWPDDWAAIRYAVSRGVVVVEAAGNGGEDLDAALYDDRPAEFPASWRNPFRGDTADSGAIVVGAGAPPPGTHGRDHGPARSRLEFSNFGARIDAQGWGREVTTTGYGDLQGGADEDLWYSDTFSGTSSASPIVVGALACYQGILAASGKRATPEQLRARLRATGSPQTDAPGRPVAQRIGNLPDVRAMAGGAGF